MWRNPKRDTTGRLLFSPFNCSWFSYCQDMTSPSRTSNLISMKVHSNFTLHGSSLVSYSLSHFILCYFLFSRHLLVTSYVFFFFQETPVSFLNESSFLILLVIQTFMWCSILCLLFRIFDVFVLLPPSQRSSLFVSWFWKPSSSVWHPSTAFKSIVERQEPEIMRTKTRQSSLTFVFLASM